MFFGNETRTGIHTRSMGPAGSLERIGAGVMNKSGVQFDEMDCQLGFYALIYVVRGTGTYRLPSGESWELKPGSVFQRHPNTPHDTVLNPNSQWLEAFVDIGPQLYQGLVASGVITPQRYVHYHGLDGPLWSTMVKHFETLKQADEGDLPSHLATSIHIITRAMASAEHTEGALAPLDLACRFLSTHYQEKRNLTLFCKHQGMGYESLRKQFVKQLGITPAQYRIRRKLDRARELLETGDLTVGQIANSLGYCSAYEFSKQFKAHTGVPPKIYRQRRQQPAR